MVIDVNHNRVYRPPQLKDLQTRQQKNQKKHPTQSIAESQCPSNHVHSHTALPAKFYFFCEKKKKEKRVGFAIRLHFYPSNPESEIHRKSVKLDYHRYYIKFVVICTLSKLRWPYNRTKRSFKATQRCEYAPPSHKNVENVYKTSLFRREWKLRLNSLVFRWMGFDIVGWLFPFSLYFQILNDCANRLACRKYNGSGH